MLRLRFLGGAWIEDDAGPLTGPPAQRHRLALLALSAEAHPRRVARSRLVGLLWPGRETGAARNLLNQSVHQIRRALGRGVLRSVGDDLRLDRTELPCDLLDFRDAIDAGDLEGAVEAYAGPFLDGFRLPGGAELERWAARQRTRLAEEQGRALEALARREEERGRPGAAVGLWRRRMALDPHADRVVLGLMGALVEAGDRAAAIREGEAHATRLREELDAAPDPDIEALVESLRRSPGERGPGGSPARASVPARDRGRETREHSDRTAAASRDAPPGLPLVGRRDALQKLREAWRAAAGQGPGLALISGEAGIGKTRLARELADWARRRRIVVATARSYPAEGRLAYGPVAEWFRSEAYREALEDLDDAWRRELAPLLPELAEEAAETPEDEVAGRHRQRFFRALARAALGDGSPRLLVLDDLQWCDPDTLQWLHYLLRFEPTAPLLVVGTARLEEVDGDHALNDLLLALGREEVRLARIELGALGPEETAALGEAVAARELDSGEQRFLFRETEGHPLFVVEGIRAGMLVGDPVRAEEEPAALPERVREVLRARLAQFGSEALEVAAVAATVGREFDPAVVRRASGMEREAVAEALDELVERRLIRRSGHALDFSHDKLREAVRSELGPHQRRLLHLRVAEALEAEHPHDVDAVAGAIAGHREAAGEPARALALYRRAAVRARRSHGHEEAAGYLQRALGLVAELPEADDRARARRELELQRMLGDCLLRTRGWAAPEVATSHRRQLELSEAVGDGKDLCRALWGLQSVRMVRADVEGARELGERLLDRAREQEDPIFVAAGHFVVGFARLLAGEFKAASAQLERGSAGYEPAREPRPAASFREDVGVLLLCGASHAAWFLGDEERALQRALEARALADRSGAPFTRTVALTYAALLHQYRGHGAMAEECAGRVVELAEEFGYAHYLYTARAVRGWAFAEGGDPGGGRQELRSALDEYEAIGSRIRLPYLLGLQAELEARLGRREVALERLETALELCDATGERWYEGELRRRKTDLEGGLE